MRYLVGYLTILALTACSSTKELFEYDPVIDTQGVNTANLELDLQACRNLGQQASVARDTAAGAAGGAVVGGAIGAAVGNSDTAQRGAGAGAILGGLRGYQGGIREEERIIRRCLTGRGYRVLN